jgi:hypothetical protein
VDPERAQEAIDRLTEIVERLRRWVVGGAGLRFAAPAEDEVSLNLARNGDAMASQAEVAVKTWADQLEAFRDGLQIQLDAYRRADESSGQLL